MSNLAAPYLLDKKIGCGGWFPLLLGSIALSTILGKVGLVTSASVENSGEGSGKAATRGAAPLCHLSRCRACTLCLVLGASITWAQAKPAEHPKKQSDAGPALTARAGKAEPPAKSVYDFSLPAAPGRAISLSAYKGQTWLLVNLARQSSYNDQLASLAKLQKDFAEKKFTVVGVPSNDFGAGEPGTEDVVTKFYADQKLGFPVMARSSLRGVDELPLFSFLGTAKDMPAGGEVHWNYTKFLIDPSGKVVARFDPDVTPDSAQLRSTLQQVLDGTFAPAKKDVLSPKSGESEEDSQ